MFWAQMFVWLDLLFVDRFNVCFHSFGTTVDRGYRGMVTSGDGLVKERGGEGLSGGVRGSVARETGDGGELNPTTWCKLCWCLWGVIGVVLGKNERRKREVGRRTRV